MGEIEDWRSVELPAVGSLWRYQARESVVQCKVLMVANLAAVGDPYEFPRVVVYEDRQGQVWAQPLARWLDRVIEVPRQSDLFEESGW